MGKIIAGILDTKVKNILAEERLLAKAVASAVIETKPISVWEIMIPIVFFFNFLQFKRSRETFSLNFLFTKKLALEAAFAMVDTGKSREAVRNQIKEKTGGVLAGDKKGLYSNKIRQKQMREIELLIAHYSRLLETDGKDYPSMLKNAYPSRVSYLAFLEELEKAEREVYQAANQTVKTPLAKEIAAKMEAAAHEFRKAEMERIFG